MPQIGVVGRNPDFMALAQAFGCAAKRPASLDEFKLILKGALAADGPTVIELRAEAHYLD
jgi:thiamine pyrophosphate-dependent acetolactate synthase large subunit-like protein